MASVGSGSQRGARRLGRWQHVGLHGATQVLQLLHQQGRVPHRSREARTKGGRPGAAGGEGGLGQALDVGARVAEGGHLSLLVAEGHLEVLGAGLDVPDLEDAVGGEGEEVRAEVEHEVHGGGVPAVHVLQLVTAAADIMSAYTGEHSTSLLGHPACMGRGSETRQSKHRGRGRGGALAALLGRDRADVRGTGVAHPRELPGAHEVASP